jgi:serine/threonine protein kinase
MEKKPKLDSQASPVGSTSGAPPRGNAADREFVDTMALSGDARSGHVRKVHDTIPGTTALPVNVGDVINGKYLIEGIIGEGGVGVVVSAQHLELDERVALKFLKQDAAADKGLVARFAREAKAAVSIKSEHVARILDVGTLPGGVPFIVMEYLEGTDLGTALQLYGTFSPAEAAEYGLHVCEALAMAHANGIIHRDIKPENLFLTTNPQTPKMRSIKVLDFGISKAALTGSVFRQEIPLVQTVHLMGTPLYMAPEQVRATSEADSRSDIWSLGMVLYEMLTGLPAFNAPSLPELCAAILEREAAPVRDQRPEVPEGLADTVERCLMKAPSDRFQNVGELANALFHFAPKRARSCAERAVGVLRASGKASLDLKFESSAPPPISSSRGGSGAMLNLGRSPTLGSFVLPDTTSSADTTVQIARQRPRPRVWLWASLGSGLALSAGIALYASARTPSRTTTVVETTRALPPPPSATVGGPPPVSPAIVTAPTSAGPTSAGPSQPVPSEAPPHATAQVLPRPTQALPPPHPALAPKKSPRPAGGSAPAAPTTEPDLGY